MSATNLALARSFPPNGASIQTSRGCRISLTGGNRNATGFRPTTASCQDEKCAEKLPIRALKDDSLNVIAEVDDVAQPPLATFQGSGCSNWLVRALSSPCVSRVRTQIKGMPATSGFGKDAALHGKPVVRAGSRNRKSRDYHSFLRPKQVTAKAVRSLSGYDERIDVGSADQERCTNTEPC